MSILSIFGGGSTAQPTSQPTTEQTGDNQTTDDAASESQDSSAAPSGNSAQTQDTTAPAATTGTDSAAATATSETTDPEAEASRVALLSSGTDGSPAQTIVEAALIESPEQIEADARRFAEAAQQQQRLEMLIEAVSTPVEPSTVTAPAAAQAQEQVGQAETDGVPV